MFEQKRQEQNLKLAVAMTIAVFCMGQIPGSIDAAISKITEYFKLSSASGLYVTTVASIVSVVFSIFIGMAAGKKIAFRPLILFCATLELITAITPFFTKNFVVLLILRGLFGIGFGGMQSLENTVAAKLIPPRKLASILGLGTFFGFGMNCILQFIGGILADKGWNYVFLNHLLLIIPYIIVVCGCIRLSFGEKESSESKNKNESENKENPDSGRLPGIAYIMWGVLFLVGVFIAPLLIGCSFLSAPINDSAAVAGFVAVCFSVGCMAGGLCYSAVFRRLPQFTLTAFILLLTLGMFGCAASRTLVLLCVFIFIAGIGFSAIQACAMTILGMKTASSKIAFASAIMMALFNLGMFLSTPYENLIGAVTGDSLYMPLYVAGVILFVLALLLLPVQKNIK